MMYRSQKTTLKKQVEEVTFKNPQFEDSQKKCNGLWKTTFKTKLKVFNNPQFEYSQLIKMKRAFSIFFQNKKRILSWIQEN